MLNFSEGTPIARVSNGRYNNKILYIDKNDNSCITPIIPSDPFEYMSEEDIRKIKKKIKASDIEAISKSMIAQRKPRDKDLQNYYPQIQNMYNNKCATEFLDYECSISPVPNYETRSVYYIGGPSGSGKSFFTGLYLEQYKRAYPKNKIYIFSRVNFDESLDIYDPVRIIINEELLEDPITAEELENSCCVFDDIDTIADDKLATCIQKLRDDLLEVGRHHNIDMLCTSHLLMNYKKTRQLLNEATHFVFFPKSGSSYHIERLLKVYCGMDKKNTEMIMSLPSRWVCISKTYPVYALYQHGCKLIK